MSGSVTHSEELDWQEIVFVSLGNIGRHRESLWGGLFTL